MKIAAIRPPPLRSPTSPITGPAASTTPPPSCSSKSRPTTASSVSASPCRPFPLRAPSRRCRAQRRCSWASPPSTSNAWSRAARHLGSFNHTPWAANFVLAGLEMALWDVLGKAAGWPVHRLLGGAVRDSVDYFGFVQGDTTDELAEDARDLAAAGYGVIYLKVGRGEAADLANTAAVRAAIGDRRLRLDPNCAWSVGEAIHMIGRLAEFAPEWIEQPTPLMSIAAMRQVKETVGVPIAADQSVFTPADVYEICRQRAADVIVLSPHEAGGFVNFAKAAAIAEAAGVAVCLHGQGVSGVTDAAQHQLGLRTANLTDGNQIMHQLLVEDLVMAPDLMPVAGKLGLFEAPGLGIELDRDAVARAAELYQRDERYHHS